MHDLTLPGIHAFPAEVPLRRCFVACLAVFALESARTAGAQGRDSSSTIPADRIEAFARAQLSIDSLRDRAQARFAEPKNKKTEVQVQLRQQLRADVLRVLKERQLTEAEFDRYTMIVSADSSQRHVFDSTIAALGAKARPR